MKISSVELIPQSANVWMYVVFGGGGRNRGLSSIHASREKF